MVEVVDAEEAYAHEKAVLRAELEEIQTLLASSSSFSNDSRMPGNSADDDNEETAKYKADLERLKALLGDVPPGWERHAEVRPRLPIASATTRSFESPVLSKPRTYHQAPF